MSDVTHQGGAIGRGPFHAGRNVPVAADPGSDRAESIGVLRTHMLANHLRAGRRSLALCSPTPDVGCTSLAVNLAVSLAQGGFKTLLVDADMRRPAVDRFITPARAGPGLSELLEDERLPLGEAICTDALPNLSILYAGAPSGRAQELLSTPRFATLIDACLRDFDITILDTPPANGSADARRVAMVAGYAMLVVGRNRTFVNDYKVLLEELTADRSTVIGTVLGEG